MTALIEKACIAENADALWRAMGPFGAIGSWHHLLTKVESEGEHEGSSRMTETQDGGRQIEQLLRNAPDRHFYRYRMESTSMPVRNYTAELRVEANHDGTSTVIWSAEFQPTSRRSEVIEEIRSFLKVGLDNLARSYGSASVPSRKSGVSCGKQRLACRTKELEVAYAVTGPIDGRPLVLVHGWPDDIGCWDKVIECIGSHDFRIYMPYLRGVGPTRFLSDRTMRSGAIAALALDLAQLLDALDLQDVLLAGYDWGARAAYGVAALFPRRLAGLIAASAGYATSMSPKAMPYELARAYWYEWYAATSQGQRAYREDRRRLCRYLWETWSPKWRGRDAEFDAIVDSLENPDWAEISIHAYRQRWHDAEGAPEHEEAERYLKEAPTISVPTIMLQGAADTDNLPITSENKEKYFTSGYERRLLPGVGHFVPREAPQAFADAILEMAAGRIRS